jgi:hypothetical protein
MHDFPYKGYLLKLNNEYFTEVRWIWSTNTKDSPYHTIKFGDINDTFVFRETHSPNSYIIEFSIKNAEIVDFKKEIRKLKLQKINK